MDSAVDLEKGSDANLQKVILSNQLYPMLKHLYPICCVSSKLTLFLTHKVYTYQNDLLQSLHPHPVKTPKRGLWTGMLDSVLHHNH